MNTVFCFAELYFVTTSKLYYCGLAVGGYWLLVPGYLLLVTGYWFSLEFSVIGVRTAYYQLLLAAGFRLSVISWRLSRGYTSFRSGQDETGSSQEK